MKLPKNNNLSHRIFLAAREQTDLGREVDWMVAVTSAIELRDVEVARELLGKAAALMRSGDLLPAFLRIYLAEAFEAIVAGDPPEQALHLKANRRRRLPLNEQTHLFMSVEAERANGKRGDDAFRPIARELRIPLGTAKKRYTSAKQGVVGEFWATFSQIVLSVSIGKNVSRRLALGDALLGRNLTSEGNDLLRTMLRVLGETDRSK